MSPLVLLALIAQLGGVQPPGTTDVDEHTTPVEASPLAPGADTPPAATPAPGVRSLDDILSAVPPYEPPAGPAQAAATEEKPRAGLVLATPAPDEALPTYLTDRNSRPDGPPTESDTLYETRILGAFRAAQGSQGPLDGRWLVARAGGDVLYALQFIDPGEGRSVEGAWRDMHAPGKGSTGFIDSVERGERDTVVRFQDTAVARSAEVRIHPSSDGGWVGQAVTAAGLVPVVMTRDQSVELAAQGAPIYVPPPAPPPRAKAKKGRHGKASKGSKSSSKAKHPAKAKASGHAPAKSKKKH